MKNKACIIPNDAIHVIELLSDEEAGILFKIIFNYVNGKEVIFRSKAIEMAFIPIKKLIDDHSLIHNAREKHWNWKGGISGENKLIRNGADIKNWRLLVFERDKYTCQRCGILGGTLHAHHIKGFAKYPEFRFDIDNGLTLCKPCHNKIHKKNG